MCHDRTIWSFWFSGSRYYRFFHPCFRRIIYIRYHRLLLRYHRLLLRCHWFSCSIQFFTTFLLKWFRYSRTSYFFFFILFNRRAVHGYFRNHFSSGQGCTYSIINCVVNFLFSCKSYLSFCRVHINIQIVSLHFHAKRDKWKFMLHQETSVGIFDCFCNNIIFNISSIDIIVLKRTIASGNFRFTNKSLNFHKEIFL